MVLTDAFLGFGRGLWQGLDLVPDLIPVAAQCLAETGGEWDRGSHELGFPLFVHAIERRLNHEHRRTVRYEISRHTGTVGQADVGVCVSWAAS